MSIFQADLIWSTALRAAIADMRKNQYLLEDAYSDLLTDPYLKSLYGLKEVERFKSFILKEIDVFVNHRPPDLIKFPCICINVGPAEEDAAKDALGDSFQDEHRDPATLGGARTDSNVIIGPVTPQSYDYLTGVMTFGPGVDLIASNVFDSQFVYDSINNTFYPIELVMDASNLLIEAGSKPNLTNMYIQTAKRSLGQIRRSIWFWRTDSLELMATDANELMYLFTLVMYILLRYKKVLWQERNFGIATISHGPISRESGQDDPNNVYGMTINIRGRTAQTVIESIHPLIGGLDFELKIADMTSPPAVLEQEGPLTPLWEGEGDPPHNTEQIQGVKKKS